ncbi:MAG: hypothetical protein LBH93_03030, partial [Chitinispirillales bacterium]|nr:hypothetical protein [Chitinispirillales bacterium]
MNRISRLSYLCAAIFLAGALCAAFAVTRWSSLQFVPNADLLPGGRLVADADLAWGLDDFTFISPVSVQRIHL